MGGAEKPETRTGPRTCCLRYVVGTPLTAMLMQRFMEHRLLSRTRITHHSCVRVLRFCQLWCRPSCLTLRRPVTPARGDRKRPKKGGVRLERPPSTTSQHLWSTPSRGDRHERRVRAPGTTSAPLCQWERVQKKRATAGVKGGRRRKKRPTKNSLIKPAIGTPTAPPAGRRRGSARSSSTAGTRAARLQPRGTSVSSLGDWPTRAWPAGSGCAPSSQPILSSTSATTYREARALAQDCDLLSP